MKKVVSLLLGVIILITLCGCGKTEKNSASDATTLTWLVPGIEPEDLPLVLEKANEIVYEKTGAKLNIIFFDTGVYQEKLNSYMSNSKEYDIAFSGFASSMANSAEMDGILPLDEYLGEYPDLKDSIPEYIWDIVKYDGKIFAIPNYQVMPVAYCVAIHGKYVDISSDEIEKIKTLEDLEVIFAKIKERADKENKEIYAFDPPREKDVPLRFDYWVDEYEKLDDLLFRKDEDGTWKGELMWESEPFKKGVEKLREWYEKGYIRPDVINERNRYFSVTSMLAYKPSVLTNLSRTYGDEIIVIPVQKPIINVCHASTVIGKDCKNPELAMKMIHLMNTDKELYNLITLGIEGVHYEKTGENSFRYIKNEFGKNNYWVNAGWKFGNQFNEYIQEGDTPDVWERTIEYNNNAKRSPFLGFSVNKKEIKSELLKIEEIVDAYSMIYLGAEHPDEYYDEFLAKLKAAGADKVVAEYEKQLNEFMSNKLNK